MKVLLLAAFVFISFTVCFPVAVNNTSANTKISFLKGSTTALKPRDEDPPSVAPTAEIDCELTKKMYTQLAITKRIRQGINYLIDHGGSWTVQPYDTTRPSCSWYSGIFVINETGEEITIEFTRIGDLAREIVNACGSDGGVNGGIRDRAGFLVIVAGFLC